MVIPAITLHDTGWNRLSQNEWMVVFNPDTTPEQKMTVRLRHQEEGVNIAQEVLSETGYPREWKQEIVEIISEHDTRKGFLSNNEGIVRDADKLWRFSKTGFDADVKRFAIAPQVLHDRIIKQIAEDGFFYSDSAREIAFHELSRRRREFASVASMTPIGTTSEEAVPTSL